MTAADEWSQVSVQRPKCETKLRRDASARKWILWITSKVLKTRNVLSVFSSYDYFSLLLSPLSLYIYIQPIVKTQFQKCKGWLPDWHRSPLVAKNRLVNIWAKSRTFGTKPWDWSCRNYRRTHLRAPYSLWKDPLIGSFPICREHWMKMKGSTWEYVARKMVWWV